MKSLSDSVCAQTLCWRLRTKLPNISFEVEKLLKSKDFLAIRSSIVAQRLQGKSIKIINVVPLLYRRYYEISKYENWGSAKW